MTDKAGAAKLSFKDYKGKDPIWCPGCGDFGVLTAMQKAAANLALDPTRTVLVTGIGCSGNITAYFRTFGIHGIHGRAVPLATGIKATNPDLTVLVAGGDGDGFGIGLSHFLHAARRNVDVTYIVMDNQVYGLTKGQTSPTTPTDMTTKASPLGPMAMPLNPLALALSAGATFVAQGYSADQPGLIALIQEAIRHKGFSFVNVQSPCVTYNLVNTFDWFREHNRKLEGHDPSDWDAAMRIANDRSGVPIGLLYQTKRPTLDDHAHAVKPDAGALQPVAAGADPAKAVASSRKRFEEWVEEFRVR
ncbi:MAG TPA: 2-oxoacid:ferredoxin oxidoreductase subunit beta [Candidatus Thermoplasmatota archaeon]|nr:2-oxoacid:ferredoxin oxidoreductase subunit beta [Candidatus Thermoplasmatota archaeon]